MNIQSLSNTFDVRRLRPEDTDFIYDLSRKNEIYYQFHPPFVTKESIREDMRALPPGKNYDDKYYVGFFEKETLAAILDLILDYPAKGVAFIGLFMMDAAYQNRNLGSKIISECAEYLKALGFQKIRLGVDKGNPQSSAFWKKNGFLAVEERAYIYMERTLIGS